MAIEQDIVTWLEEYSGVLYLHEADGRRALLFQADLDELSAKISVEGPTHIFCRNIVAYLAKYGKLSDGRDPLEALLHAARDMVGIGPREVCERLRQSWLAEKSSPSVVMVPLKPINSQCVTVPERPMISPAISLRNQPRYVPEHRAAQSFGVIQIDGNTWKPGSYMTHQYEDRGDVVFDHATGLTWQKSRSDDLASIKKKEQEYIATLNQTQFAGYTDWRLPTIPELMSLLESEKQSNHLYLDPIFHSDGYECCLSADRATPNSDDLSPPQTTTATGVVVVTPIAFQTTQPQMTWCVSFHKGHIYRTCIYNGHHVRSVRP